MKSNSEYRLVCGCRKPDEECTQASADKYAFALGVNIRRAGFGTDVFEKKFSKSGWPARHFEKLQEGFDAVETDLPLADVFTIDGQYLVNKFIKRCTDFTVVRWEHHDSAESPNHKSELHAVREQFDFVVLRHKRRAFEVLYSVVQVLHLDGSCTYYPLLKFNYDTAQERCNGALKKFKVGDHVWHCCGASMASRDGVTTVSGNFEAYGVDEAVTTKDVYEATRRYFNSVDKWLLDGVPSTALFVHRHGFEPRT